MLYWSAESIAPLDSSDCLGIPSFGMAAKQKTSFTLSRDALKELERIAKHLGISKSAALAIAILDWRRMRKIPEHAEAK